MFQTFHYHFDGLTIADGQNDDICPKRCNRAKRVFDDKQYKKGHTPVNIFCHYSALTHFSADNMKEFYSRNNLNFLFLVQI